MNDDSESECGDLISFVIKKTRTSVITSIICFLCLPFGIEQVTAQSPPIVSMSLEDGLWIQKPDSSVAFRLGFRFQEQFSSTRNLDNNNTRSEFQLRRLRLAFAGHAIGKKLSWFFMPSFDRGNTSLEIVRIKWQLTRNTWVYGGQINQPGTREFMQTSGNLQFVDRSTTDRLFRLGYDSGVGLIRKFAAGRSDFRFIATITNGEGQNQRAADGGLSYTGRIEFYPFGEFNALIGSDFGRSDKPQLIVAAALNINQDAMRIRNHFGPFLEDASSDIYVWFIESSFRLKGLSVHGTFVRRFASDNLLNDGIPGNLIFEGNAFNLEAGYFLSDKTEVVSRFEQVFPDSELRQNFNEERSIVLGVNRFFIGHRLKIQADFKYDTLRSPLTENSDFLTFRSQFQLEF